MNYPTIDGQCFVARGSWLKAPGQEKRGAGPPTKARVPTPLFSYTQTQTQTSITVGTSCMPDTCPNKELGVKWPWPPFQSSSLSLCSFVPIVFLGVSVFLYGLRNQGANSYFNISAVRQVLAVTLSYLMVSSSLVYLSYLMVSSSLGYLSYMMASSSLISLSYLMASFSWVFFVCLFCCSNLPSDLEGALAASGLATSFYPSKIWYKGRRQTG